MKPFSQRQFIFGWALVKISEQRWVNRCLLPGRDVTRHSSISGDVHFLSESSVDLINASVKRNLDRVHH